MSSSLSLLTWNINGVRSFSGDKWSVQMDAFRADVVCVQETKVTRSMLEESFALLPNFTSYYAFSRRKTGYSGVATYCAASATPTHCEEGLGGTLPSARLASAVGCMGRIGDEFSPEELQQLDAEGRAVITRHQVKGKPPLVVINVYCPRVDPERAEERGAFQARFYRLLELRARAFTEEGHLVVIVGDINTAHKEIDHCEPREDFELKPGRQWMDRFLQPSVTLPTTLENPARRTVAGADSDVDDDVDAHLDADADAPRFVDCFRRLHPSRPSAFTCWNTFHGCRSTNYGTRLDYILASPALAPFLVACDIRPDVLGSDHCPVVAEFKLDVAPADRCPEYCTKNFTEFGGQQRKVSAFFVKRTAEEVKDAQKAAAKRRPAAPKQAKLDSFFAKKPEKSREAATAENLKRPDAGENAGAGNSNVGCENRRESAVALNDDAKRDSFDSASLESAWRRNSATASAWKALFKGPPDAPACRGHGDKAVLRTVKKKGANMGRQFWCCPRGEGRADDKEARCDFFQWVVQGRKAK